jgi:hypothetical protein
MQFDCDTHYHTHCHMLHNGTAIVHFILVLQCVLACDHVEMLKVGTRHHTIFCVIF